MAGAKPSSELSASEANALWRGSLGHPLSAADRRDIASFFGVSERTVERWTTQATEQRNPISPRLEGVPYDAWPTKDKDRADFANLAARGYLAPGTDPRPHEQYVERFARLTDAVRWLNAVREGELDPWVNASTRGAKIEKTASGWIVRVVYVRIDSP